MTMNRHGIHPNLGSKVYLAILSPLWQGVVLSADEAGTMQRGQPDFLWTCSKQEEQLHIAPRRSVMPLRAREQVPFTCESQLLSLTGSLKSDFIMIL